MPVLIDYIIKLNICLAVVYLFYQLFLRRLTFYNWNRWYLVGYTALSFIIPLIDVMPSLQEKNLQDATIMQFIPVLSFTEASTQNFFNTLTWWDWAIAVLILGSLFLLTRLVLRLFAFAKMKTRAHLISDAKTKIYQLDDKISPFSFGNSIFINADMHGSEELEEIIRHEFVHIKQRHTVDIMWCELLCILNWFNPAVWLLRHNVRQNLEFIADDKVLQNGLDKKDYQYLLLKVIGNQQFAFTNHFNFSSLKKRIVMMNTYKTAKIHLTRFLFLLPVIAVLLLSFRNEVKKTNENILKTNIDNSVVELHSYPQIQDEINEEKVINDTVPKAKKDESPSITLRLIKDTVAVNKPIYIVDNVEVLDENWTINSVNPDEIKSVEVLKDGPATSPYGSRGKNGVVKITTQKAGNREKPLQLSYMPGDEPLCFLDGKSIPYAVVKQMDENSIKSVSVLKGTEAIEKYGSEAKSGVVLITSKKATSPGDIVFTLDGSQIKMKEGDTVLVADSIRFVKGIKLPNNAGENSTPSLKPVLVTGFKIDKNKQLSDLPPDAYYVLDGKRVKQKQIKKLNPADIKSIDVLKGEKALQFYGKKAKDGAVVIVTK